MARFFDSSTFRAVGLGRLLIVGAVLWLGLFFFFRVTSIFRPITTRMNARKGSKSFLEN